MSEYDAIPRCEQAVVEMVFAESAVPGETHIFDIFEQSVCDTRVRLYAAIESGDLHEAGHSAHQLKGSCAAIGVVRLSRITGDLESAALAGDVDRVRQLKPILETELNALLKELGDVRLRHLPTHGGS